MKIHQISFHNNQQILSENGGKTNAVLAQEIIDLLRDKQMSVGFAESCTGGLLSSELTKIPGVSDVFCGAIVSYVNSVKNLVLGVSQQVLDHEGAVSAACAEQMALGALRILKTDCAVAITGMAGPKSGSNTVAVGCVFIAVAGTDKARGNEKKTRIEIFQHDFSQSVENNSGKVELLNREEIQKIACAAALNHLRNFLKEN